MNILMTGGTGFIGKRLVWELSKHPSVTQIYLCVRYPEKINKGDFPEKVSMLHGDITKEDIFFSRDDQEKMKEIIDSVVHFAALYNIEADSFPSYLSNVIGTQQFLDFAGKIKNLKHFHYTSTVAVAGDHVGLLEERPDYPPNIHFEHDYGKTKMAAEVMALNHPMNNAQKRIYRFGITVGDSKNGEIQKIDGPYYFLKFLETNFFMKYLPLLLLPYKHETELPLVPVDFLVEWLVRLITNLRTDESTKVYHLIPKEKLLFCDFFKEMKEFYPVFGSVHSFHSHFLWKKIFSLLKIPVELLGHMSSKCVFERKALWRDYPDLRDVAFKDYKHAMVNGLRKFIKR